MKKYFCIISNNEVIDRVVGDDIEHITYPFSYDLVIEDTDHSVAIRAIYDPVTNTFSVITDPLTDEEIIDMDNTEPE